MIDRSILISADYLTKIRALIFNTKKNTNLREKVILGSRVVDAKVLKLQVCRSRLGVQMNI